MSNTYYINTAVLVLGFLISNAQNKKQLTAEMGMITDAVTQLPVEGATVRAIPGQQATLTNEQGKFILKLLHQPIDSIRISSIGHETKTIAYADFKQNKTSISLDQQVIQLSEITVALNPGDQYKPISKIDIQMRGINNSQEVLRIIPGLFIGQHAGGGKAEQIFLRGFDLDHGTDINISTDGIPVNMVSHAHGQGYADLHFIIPELIDNVYFKKGTYSTEKGNFATAGHVDFRLKTKLPANLVKLEAGQFNTLRGVAAINLLGEKSTRKNQSAYIGSEYMFTRGFFDHPQNFKRVNLFGKYYGKIGANNTLTFSASSFQSKWNASGQIPDRAFQKGLISFFGSIDPDEGGSTGRSNVNAQLTTSFKDGNYLKNQLYYSNYDFQLFSNFTFFLNDSINGDQIGQKERRHLFGYNGSYTRIGFINGKKITTELGIMARLDKTTNSELSRTKNRLLTVFPMKMGNINELNTSFYLDETILLNEFFSLNAGIRYDYFIMNYLDKLDGGRKLKMNTGILSPKLNFYYHVNDRTEIYVSAGKGFHSNDTRVAVQRHKNQTLPAAYGADLGAVLKPVPNLLLNAALWYLSLDQEFVYVGDEGIIEPSGKSRRTGIDLSARYQVSKRLFMEMDVNYSKGRSVDAPKGESFLPLAPVFTSVGGITYKSGIGLNASIRYRYMGDRPADETNSVVAKGYFVTDAFLNYVRARYEIGLKVQNMFDVRWKETQFNTESRLRGEPQPVSEIHFTPGTPIFIKGGVSYLF